MSNPQPNSENGGISNSTPTAPREISKDLKIHTYHCICSTLILATPYKISELPRRESGQDQAIILPLGRPPVSSSSLTTLASLQAAEDGEEEEVDKEGTTKGDGAKDRDEKRGRKLGYSILLNTIQDRKPIVIRREDGFEKRWVRRCGRCRVGIGYVLSTGDGVEKSEEGGEMNGGEEGEVVYLVDGLRGSGELL